MALDLVPRLGGAQPWKDSEPLECVSVVPEGPNIVSFSFRAPSGAWFDYRPGQFLTLELPVAGGPVHRTYTLSSSPSRPLSITLTVKAQSSQPRDAVDARQPARGHAGQGDRAGRDLRARTCRPTASCC